MKFVF